MAVVFDANATADVTANAVTSITSSNLTVGVAANRALLCQINWSIVVSAITINWDQLGTPQALTVVTGAVQSSTDATPNRVEVWGLVAPTSGAKQLKAAWTSAADVYMNQLSYSGVNQTGGATSFPNGTGANGNTITPTVVITSAVGDAAVALHSTKTSSTSSVNGTQTFLDNTAASMSAGGNRNIGAATVTLTCTLLAIKLWCSAGCDVAASGATTAPFVPISLSNPQFKFDSRRDFDSSSNFKLLKDSQFRGVGQTQTYDYPNPNKRPYSPVLNSFTNSFDLALLSKDTFFGSPGMGPNYDYPNPKFALKSPGDGFATLLPELLGKDTFFGSAGQGVANLDFPNPKVAPFILKSHTDSFKLELIGKDSLPFGTTELGILFYKNKQQLDIINNLLQNTLGFIPVPFQLNDWPLPFSRKDVKLFINDNFIRLIGQDSIILQNYDQFNPSFKRSLYSEETLNLLQNTLGIIPTPFLMNDWPLPGKIDRSILLHSFIDNTKIQLIGQDQFFGSPGQPSQTIQWEFPKGRIVVVDLKTGTTDLLQTTLAPSPISGSNGLIIIEGRMAKKIHGIIYVYVD